MKKVKLLTKFKKLIIVIMCFITIGFSAPIKSEAGILGDFLDLVLRIPDVVMWVGNFYLSSIGEVKTEYGLNLKGVHPTAGDNGRIYNFMLTPYRIFTNGSAIEYRNIDDESEGYYINLPILDCNFFAETSVDQITGEETRTTLFGKILPLKDKFRSTNSAAVLRPVVSNVYKSLRNLCLIIMMLVLMYIGIKILLSSVAESKAKYKQMLIDWLVGFCLLFIMHYIMSFIMNLNELVINMLSNDENDIYYMLLAEQGDGSELGTDWKSIKEDKYKSFADLHVDVRWDYTAGNYQSYDLQKDINGRTYVVPYTRKSWGEKIIDQSGNETEGVFISCRIYDEEPDVCLYRCNLMEYLRTMSCYSGTYVNVLKNNRAETQVAEDDTDNESTSTFALGVLYLILVAETVMFMVVYIKRVFQLAFLTMIAPLVALMYPVDKIGDGKAQAFNTWFKDYLFNVLIQPLHLILYTIFISAAGQLFEENIIYAIGMYAFMIPAEKYFKNVFGFNKASTGGGGGLAGAAGAGMIMGGLGKLTGLGPGSGHKGGGGGAGKDDSKKIKVKKLKPNIQEPTPTPTPTPGSNGRFGKLKNAAKAVANSGFGKTVGATGKTMGRRILGAATGGKYNQFKGEKLSRVGAAIAKTGGRKIVKVAGAIGGGTVGLMAGIASAAVTGNAGHITQGASIGLAAGLKQSGNLYDATTNWGSEFINDTKAIRAENDDTYAGKLRADDALESFKGEDLSDNDKEIVEKYAPYVDFNGDKDKLKAIVEADRNGNSLDQVLQAESESKSWSDLKKESNKSSYINYQTSEKLSKITDNDVQVTQSEIDQLSRKNKQKSIEEAEKQRDDAIAKRNKEIADAKSAGDLSTARAIERKRDVEKRKNEQEINNRRSSAYDRDAAERQLLDAKKKEKAEEAAMEDYQRALEFQENSKKNSK